MDYRLLKIELAEISWILDPNPNTWLPLQCIVIYRARDRLLAKTLGDALPGYKIPESLLITGVYHDQTNEAVKARSAQILSALQDLVTAYVDNSPEPLEFNPHLAPTGQYGVLGTIGPKRMLHEGIFRLDGFR